MALRHLGAQSALGERRVKKSSAQRALCASMSSKNFSDMRGSEKFFFARACSESRGPVGFRNAVDENLQVRRQNRKRPGASWTAVAWRSLHLLARLHPCLDELNWPARARLSVARTRSALHSRPGMAVSADLARRRVLGSLMRTEARCRSAVDFVVRATASLAGRLAPL